jgi:uncharacterized protein (TIRG00374 family)
VSGSVDVGEEGLTPLASAAGPARATRGRRSLVFRLLRWGVSLAALGLAADVLVTQGNELSGASVYLAHLDPRWLAVGAAAELVSMLCYAFAQRRVLAEAGSQLGIGPVFGITLAANAVSNSLPAGPAFGAAYLWRQLRRRSVPEVAAGWSILAVNVTASSALAVLAAVGVAAAFGQSTAFDLVIVVSATVLVAFGALALLREPQMLAWALAPLARVARRLTGHPRSDPRALAERVHDLLASIRPSWRGLSVAFSWSLGNWVLDLGCLVAAFGAVGIGVPWRALVLAYGAAQLAANLPITPGGLGVVEGSLTIGLVAYGGAEARDVAAVLLYRIISFWGLVVLGWAVAGGLAMAGRAVARRATP